MRALCEYCCRNSDTAIDICNELIAKRAQTMTEEVEAYVLMAELYLCQHKYKVASTNWQLFRNPSAKPCYLQEITRIGVDFLRHLGLSMPYEASTDDVEAEVDKINTLLANKPISSLIDSPFVTDQKACYLIISPNMICSVFAVANYLLYLLFFLFNRQN